MFSQAIEVVDDPSEGVDEALAVLRAPRKDGDKQPADSLGKMHQELADQDWALSPAAVPPLRPYGGWRLAGLMKSAGPPHERGD